VKLGVPTLDLADNVAGDFNSSDIEDDAPPETNPYANMGLSSILSMLEYKDEDRKASKKGYKELGVTMQASSSNKKTQQMDKHLECMANTIQQGPKWWT
jgi:hypothetical protein